MKKFFSYIQSVFTQTVDNDDLFLCLGTSLLFYGVSLIHLPSAIILLGIIFLVLAFIAATPQKIIHIEGGQT